MKARALGAAGWFFFLTAAPLLSLGPGCARRQGCSSEESRGCLHACDQGDLPACRTLGLSLTQTQGSGLRAGAMLLERACLAGDTPSCERLKTLPVSFVSAVASAPPPPRTLPCPSALASASSSISSFALASAPAPAPPAPQLPPDLPPLAPEASREALDLAARCARGEGVACTHLGPLFDEGIGVPRSKELAIRACSLGCVRNDAQGCRLAGRALEQEQPTQAILFLRRGCVGSDPGACASLGELALRNASPELTPAYGANQLRSACTNAYAPACRSLARLLREGTTVPKDEDAAARIEGRSLDLAQQSCTGGNLEDCLLLGLWQERPGVLGEQPGDTPRTTDTTSLESALTSYQKACDGGHPGGCRRGVELLDAMRRKEPADALWARLDGTCAAGDAASCGELLREQKFHTPSAEALSKACELALPGACLALGGAGARKDPAALLRACRLGSGAGCEAYLNDLAQRSPEKLSEARTEVCERTGGAACVALATAVQEEGCALRLVRRACEEAPTRTAPGCAEAAAYLRKRDPRRAEALDRLACELARKDGILEGKTAESCGHLARARGKESPEEARQLAADACKAGAALGCAALAELLRGGKNEGDRKLADEAATKACKQGHPGACAQVFGPLPSTSVQAAIRRPILPDAPAAGCSLATERSASVPGAGLGLVLLFCLRRRPR